MQAEKASRLDFDRSRLSALGSSVFLARWFLSVFFRQKGNKHLQQHSVFLSARKRERGGERESCLSSIKTVRAACTKISECAIVGASSKCSSRAKMTELALSKINQSEAPWSPVCAL